MSDAKPPRADMGKAAGADRGSWGRLVIAARQYVGMSRSYAGLWAAAVVFVALTLGWYDWYSIVDFLTSDASKQGRVAITVASPTVHTRERLLNDRFEQVAWLDQELLMTVPQVREALGPPPAATADPTVPAPVQDAPSRDLVGVSQSNVQTRYGFGDPRQDFAIVNGYRDVLRAERARAMLDDRHDMDENTLDLFSFDTTVMPRNDARGYAAVEVVITPELRDLIPSLQGSGAVARLNEQRYTDLFDIYLGWLEKVRELQKKDLSTVAKTIDLPGDWDRSDYQATLRIGACASLLEATLNEGIVPLSTETIRGMAHSSCVFASKTEMASDQITIEPASPDAVRFIDEAREAFSVIDQNAKTVSTEIVDYSPKEYLNGLIDLILKADVRSIAAPSGTLSTDFTFGDPESGKASIGRVSADWDRQNINPNAQPKILDANNEVIQTLKSVSMLLQECHRGESSVEAAENWRIMRRGGGWPRFFCSQISNANWRIFQAFSEVTKVSSKQTGFTNQIEQYGRDVTADVARKIPTSCIAAALLEEGLVRRSTDLPRNHGAALADFFDIQVVNQSQSCSLNIQPRIPSLRYPQTLQESDALRGSCLEQMTEKLGQAKVANPLCLLDRLESLLEGPGYGNAPIAPVTRAYAYTLSPRLSQNMQMTSGVTDALSVGSGSFGVRTGQSSSLDVRSVEPEVVGYSRPISPAADRRHQGARFGWLISPRPARGLNQDLPMEQAQLSAVVALPSWWRSALLQVCTRFVPLAAVGRVNEDEFWNDAALNIRQCRVEMIRLPGGSADISRRLGMDVLTTPYVEDWKDRPVLLAGETGEPKHLLITGERLWRNTVVTLGGQKADRIEVLPDMSGITATFFCVRSPPMGANLTPPPETPTSANLSLNTSDSYINPYTTYSVPVIVWTSEGHSEQLAANVAVKNEPNPYPPCRSPERQVLTSEERLTTDLPTSLTRGVNKGQGAISN